MTAHQLRTRLVGYRFPALLIAVMLVTVIGAFVGVRTARSAMHSTRASVPPIVEQVPWLASSYLDRAAIHEQVVGPPRLIRTLLWPTLGSPAVVDPEVDLDVVLDRPVRGATLALIPRDALAELDRDLYALPARPQGAALVAAQIAAAQGEEDAGSSNLLVLPEERRAIGAALGDVAYQHARLRLLARVKDDSGAAVHDAVERVRSSVARVVAGNGNARRPLIPQGDCVSVGVGSTCVVKVRAPADLGAGLYSIVLMGPDGTLLDVQMNAAYRPADVDAAPTFVLASDMQWGDAPAIADTALSFVSLMNALSAAGKAPDFIIMAGDVVDGQFGSAGSVWSKLFGGAENYTRDFLQAWLVLAALRVPIYLVPGNHDGYRFQDAVGELRSDGLLMFQSTFGPLYHAVDRPPWRLVFLNSYDLPSGARTVRRGEASNIVERFSDRLNVLNWGGGMRAAQHRWLRRQLGLDGAPGADLSVALIMHHDPRGGYPALRREFQQRQHQWTTDRHVPITTDLMEATDRSFQRTPRFADTEEIHLGYYTPFRDERTMVRGSDWFDMGMRVALPDSLGWPGWSKYQQGWHAPAVYGRGFSDIRRASSADLVAPPTILRTIIDGHVRAIFKGHDNRFAHAHMSAGESIFTRAAEGALLQTASVERRKELKELRLRDSLDVYHVADLSDFNTDGHGVFWVIGGPNSFTVLPLDHW